MIKVGKIAPDFICDAALDGQIKQISLKDFHDSYKLLFFYPLDFTFVCPTELHALQEHLDTFEKLSVQVLAISVDSAHSHLAWLHMPKNKGGIEGISYPLLSDITKSIAREYGVLHEEKGVALRGSFLLDKNNIVQYASINNLSLGRNIQELLRIVHALLFVEKHGEVCPADWNAGKKGLKATQEGLKTYFNTQEA